eukprot:3940548-Pyramimonas_sp.AAC.1
MKGWNHLNRVLNPSTWEASRAGASYLGSCGAEFAGHQLAVGNHFLNEQPLGSDVCELEGGTGGGEVTAAGEEGYGADGQ